VKYLDNEIEIWAIYDEAHAVIALVVWIQAVRLGNSRGRREHGYEQAIPTLHADNAGTGKAKLLTRARLMRS